MYSVCSVHSTEHHSTHAHWTDSWCFTPRLIANKKMAVRYILGGGKKPRQTPTELSIRNVFGLRQVTVCGLVGSHRYPLYTSSGPAVYDSLSSMFSQIVPNSQHSSTSMYDIWQKFIAHWKFIGIVTQLNHHTRSRDGANVTILMSPNAALCSLVTAWHNNILSLDLWSDLGTAWLKFNGLQRFLSKMVGLSSLWLTSSLRWAFLASLTPLKMYVRVFKELSWRLIKAFSGQTVHTSISHVVIQAG